MVSFLSRVTEGDFVWCAEPTTNPSDIFSRHVEVATPNPNLVLFQPSEKCAEMVVHQAIDVVGDTVGIFGFQVGVEDEESEFTNRDLYSNKVFIFLYYFRA